MINQFSFILMIMTGISGIFWFLKKISIVFFRYSEYTQRLLYKFNNLNSSNLQKNISFFFVNFFEFISSMFPILLLILTIRFFVIEPFQIPSGSMMPTLLVGDFILVKKFAYGINNPINQKILVKIGNPNRGDVIVFKYPDNPKLDYVKRVIGKPGDKIVYNVINKQLTIYPVQENNIYKKKLPIIYKNTILSNFVQTFHTSACGEVSTIFINLPSNQKVFNGIRLVQTTESFNGKDHEILTMIPPGNKNYISIYDKYAQNFVSEWIVPVGKYFVMGDNRDNSSDSRYWGYVPEHYVVGQVVAIWMSFEKQENQWPTGVRLNRIGYIR